MPELPEVECVRRTLEPSLIHRRPSRVSVSLDKMVRPGPKEFAAGIRGKMIQPLERHGKLLIMPR
jgi:formamidopyrimidine-DNA glycosylase